MDASDVRLHLLSVNTQRGMRFRWPHAILVCAVLCALAIAYADRAIVLALDSAYRQSPAWRVVDRFFLAVVPLFVFIAIAGAWITFTVRGRRRTTWWAEDLRTCALVGAVALILAKVLKVIFGRSGPDFTFVRDGVYEFRWFTGTWTPYHGAFPSGTTAVMTAMATALWMRRSPFRVAGLVIAATLSIMVVVQQYHWLSDAIAGAALGAAVSWAVAHALAGRRTAAYTPL